MKSKGTKVINYVNIGSAETFRSYWSQVSPYRLDPYINFPDEFWMDVAQPRYQEILLNAIVPKLSSKGIDGFFLDNLDVVDKYPNRFDIRQAVVEIVRTLRTRYPNYLIIGNRGFTILNDIGSDNKTFYQYLYGLLVESVNSTYNLSSGIIQYVKVDETKSNQMLDRLAFWKSKGLMVMTLDYAITDDLAIYAYNRSKARGLLPYVSNMSLNDIYFGSFDSND